MIQSLDRIRVLIIALGVVLFFVSERYLAFESYHQALIALAFVLVACGPIIGVLAARVLHRPRQLAVLTAAWPAALLIAGALFLSYQHSLTGSGGTPSTALDKLFLGSWLITGVLAVSSGIGIEMAYLGRNALSEPRRVAQSGLSWLMVGMLLSTLVCLNYAGVKRNVIRDWSYLKTTSASDSTVKMANTAAANIDVALFFPQNNDVRPFVAEYFASLASRSTKIAVVAYDKDLQPSKAEEFKVSKNGQIVFRVGEKRERIDVGTELTGARSTLRKLDSEVQKMMLRLIAERKKIYFTRGHGEFSWSSNEKDKRRRIDLVEEFLRSQNYQPATLAVAEGTTQKIPDDAAAVVIVGPDQPFLDAEVRALGSYLDGGGRVMVLADVESATREGPSLTTTAADPLFKFLEQCGLAYKKVVLANEKSYANLTNSKEDRWFIFSNSFSSHESVTTLSRNEERAALLVMQSGYFNVEPVKGDWRATTTVRSIGDTFEDLNRNFTRETAQEKTQTFSLGAVSTKVVIIKDKDGKDTESEGRIVALGDASAINDILIRNKANLIYLVESLRWLTGQEDLGGAPTNEEDVKIVHTNKQDALWFNATIFVMPCFVLLLGFLATRRRKSDGKGSAL